MSSSKHYRVEPKKSRTLFDILLLALTVVFFFSYNIVSTQKKETESIILGKLREVNQELVLKEEIAGYTKQQMTLLLLAEE